MCCWEPAPEVANPNPGFCLASATSSASVFTPSEGCTAITTGWRESCTTGMKSFNVW